MPIPHLPAETTDEIIAWIPVLAAPAIYYPTLLSCCLVSSRWLSASRHHLFQEVYIRSTWAYDIFVTRVLRQDTMRALLSQIHTLTLARKPWSYCKESTFPFPHTFAGQLPSLTVLHVSSGSLEIYFSNHPRAFFALSRFHSIRELQLYDASFLSFGALRNTLIFLPNLAILNLAGYLSWPEPSIELSALLEHRVSGAGRPKLAAISMLRFGHTPVAARRARRFLTWLNTTSTSLSLRELTLDHFVHLDVLGPSILHLCRFVERFKVVRPDYGGEFCQTAANSN